MVVCIVVRCRTIRYDTLYHTSGSYLFLYFGSIYRCHLCNITAPVSCILLARFLSYFLPAFVCWWIICQYIVIDDLHCQRISPLSMSVLIYGHIRLLKVNFLYGGTLMGFFSICYLWFLWFCIFVSILDEWVVIVNGSLHVDENFLYLTMFFIPDSCAGL